MAWKAPERAGATVFVWANYSLVERNRRWQAVRERAAKAGLDCVFVPLGDGTDARYLTQLRCSSVVLPTDGRPPIVIADRGSRNEWVTEPWQTSREWTEPMAQALMEAGMERARIGVAGLKRGQVTHVSALDGAVNHTAFSEVRRRLPNATFEDATDIVGFVRHVKSREESECLRRGASMAEAAIETLAQLARPGLDAALLYARVIERLIVLGSEYYPLAITCDSIAAQRPMRYAHPPIGRRLGRDSLIQSEVGAIWGAELVEAVQPILLGRVPEEWRPVIELQREVFEEGLRWMRPGTTLGALIDRVNGFGAKRGMRTAISLKGCGYGDDGPILTPGSEAGAARSLTIDKGNVFVWRPLAASADGRMQFVWGGAVEVGDEGGRPLFERAHGMISVA